MRNIMLTTSDNPYDPFLEFEQWNSYDQAQNYNTCSYLARITKSSDELSETDQEQAIEQAIDEIIDLNVLGIYKKVERIDL